MANFLNNSFYLQVLYKISKILNKNEKKSLLILIIFVLVGMIFEVAGLGVLIPLISIIIKPDFIIDNKLYLDIFYLSDFDRFELIIIILGLVLIFYVFKFIFVSYLSFRQNRFLSNLNASVTKRLFKAYLNQRYSFFLKKKSSNIIKIIQVETSYFNSVCTGIITLVVEVLLFAAVLITMIIIDPYATIISSISIIFFSYLLSNFLKKRLTTLGVERSSLDENLNTHTIQSFEGIRDLKIFGIENLSSSIFDRTISKKALILSKYNTYSQFPRFFLEFITVVGLIGFILTQLILGNSTNDILTTLGIFVAATFRLIPSVNKILVSAQNIRFYSPSINSIVEELNSFKNSQFEHGSNKTFSIENNIKINDLSYRYDTNKPWIFKNLNLNIKQGEVIGIIGKSGTGKSTLVDLISGLISPCSGNIECNGNLISDSLEFWKNNLGYVSQNIFLLEGTIAENIAIGIPNNEINLEKIQSVIKLAKIDDFINSLDLGLQTEIHHNGKEFSGGQIKRIALARALYKNPRLIILDETTSALDSETEKIILNTIMSVKNDKFVFIVTHNNESFSLFDKLYEISEQKLKKIIL
jgi:ATP-binding cassette, subfamily B, bacterial PglK